MLIKQKGLLTTVGATLISLGFVGSAEAVSLYSVTDLGSLVASTYSYANDINHSGQAIFDSGVGTSNGSPSRAFLYNDGQVTEIKPLPGDTDIAVTSINSFGQVVGNSVNENNFTGNNPLLYSDGKTQSLVGLNDAIPYAINDKGEVVGGAQGIGPFLYRDETVISLGTEGTVAYGINNQSQIVGILNSNTAFLYENGTTTEIGTLPGDNYSSAEGINDLGQVVGVSAPTGVGDGRAFLYSKSTGLVNLGRLFPSDLFSVALDINNNGQVVGFSGSNLDFFSTSGGIRAFIYSDGKLQDLNDLISPNSGLTLTQARAINNRGQIVGAGSINGELHAVLLTPVSQSVPEPSTLLATGLALSVGVLSTKSKKTMNNKP
jgi:probable HAF family extracellular repeat protein